MSAGASIAVYADFDDTLTTQNVAHFLLKRFAPGALKRFSTQYRAGEISFREYQEKSFNAVDATVSEMQEAAANEIELRSGLAELLKAVSEAGAVFTVASAGLDLYIDPVLKRHGLEALSVICGSALRTGSDSGEFRYDYPFPYDSADGADDSQRCRGDWATCKCKALEQSDEGAITIFVGDGNTSDACAAEKADHVFARDRLLKICKKSNITATPFEDFSPVTELVRQLGTEAKTTRFRDGTKDQSRDDS